MFTQVAGCFQSVQALHFLWRTTFTFTFLIDFDVFQQLSQHTHILRYCRSLELYVIANIFLRVHLHILSSQAT
jgi:hypothetical protein